MLHVPLQFWRRKQLVTAQFAITIAIGLGATTALSSLMLAIGYQALPYRDPKQLVVVWERAESGAQVMAVSGPRLTDFAEATRASIFATLDAFAVPQRWLLDRVGATQIRACYIQASALSDLGVRPVLGREARPDDEPLMGGSGTAPVWISSHFWQTRYNSNQSVIGSTIGIASSATGSDQTPARIVGVLPSETAISLPFMDNATDVWYILAPQQLLSLPRQATMFFGIGRLRPGVSAAQAQAALTAIAERLEQRFSTERGRRPVVQSLEEIAQGPARRTMGLLSLAVGLVFLLGCVNLAILMAAKGRRRRLEIAIRSAIGPGRAPEACDNGKLLSPRAIRCASEPFRYSPARLRFRQKFARQE